MSQISTESVSTNAILYQEKMLAVARLASGLSSDVGELVDAAAASIREALVTAGGVSDDRSLENAAASLQRASMILRQIELFARAAPVKPTLRSLARVINDLLPLAHRLAGESVRVLSGPFEESVWVMADAGNLEQVLFHLVVNARDAMPTGGSVRLSIRRVQTVEPLSHRHGVLDAGDWAVLEVIDSGTGMPEAVLNRIFEPFFTTKAPGSGSGLGLATVYGIARQLGGAVHVESGPGGTAVAVWLPARAAPMVRQTTEGSAVLLVDDNEWARAVTAMGLRRAGYGVLEADDSEQAWEVLGDVAGECVQVIVADAALPRLAELARRVRSNRPGTRMVLMSDGSSALSASAALHKPFSRDQLLRAVAG